MTRDGRFKWHAQTRLYAGELEISRPSTTGADAFRALPAFPPATALTSLGAAIADRAPFCLSDLPLPETVTCAPDQFLTLTGGASGHPKAVRRSQASWIASFTTNATRFGLKTPDSVAVLGQLSHSLSLYGLLEAMHLGLDAHVLAGISPRQQAKRLATVGATLLYATPTQLRLLARGGTAPLPSLRLVLCGGGALDAATRQAVRALCPRAALHEFYGAAETSFITISGADTPDGSVGRAYPGVELQLRDQAGQLTDGPGEIWVRSPYLFEGYALGASAETGRNAGFVTVGEIGTLDHDGNLWIKGRRKRMVNIADQVVFPEAVEAVIAAQDGAGCAVVPRHDPLRGMHLVAVIEGPRDAARATAIQSACRAELGPLATPRTVLFRSELPLLPSGKIDLSALTTWLESQS